MSKALLEAVLEKELNTVKRLLQLPEIDINYQNEDGETALHYAAENNNPEILDQLLEKKADVSKKDKFGDTALHRASHLGNLEAVRQLLEKGSDVNALNKDDETPLHLSVYSNREEVVGLLVKQGANVNAQRKNGDTPLYMAARLYCLNNSLPCKLMCKIFVAFGADVNIKNDDGDTPYTMAFKDQGLMFELLQSKLKIKEVNTTKSSVGDTGLHLAALSKNKKLCEALIIHGANPSLENHCGQSPCDIVLSDPSMQEYLGDKLFNYFKIQAQEHRNTQFSTYSSEDTKEIKQPTDPYLLTFYQDLNLNQFNESTEDSQTKESEEKLKNKKNAGCCLVM
ncbi:ankyrin repeat domain-containing protein [Thiotrichales bacterium 19S11-10]|nr:ankyrin repeat domain-containing protein [Thiotrichales bacterium 19S11-10]